MVISWQKPLLFVLLLTPFLLLLSDVLLGHLIDPIEEITNPTGQWALRFLLFSLLITPLNEILSFSLIKYRRMIGVFSFFYACLHLSIYLIDQNFEFQLVLADVMKQSYTAIGFSAFILLFLLAITSTNKMVRRLGKRWKKLHKSIYLIIILVIVHFYWQAKSSMDIEPIIYGLIALLLLGFRINWKRWLNL
ncbi:sulfite oxidase subunit YedZ [Abyssogena phaseoliformis symbiont OG214]|uniref:sulfite oxidase heme-binding subunit YedZ n=1 Tax=Abyssogena phaseoliformis symbiont TaxID=596095 RepID=UPI001915E0B2|nr:protein-methionine-sulfoxide reductase heme-binding subunit MsrQ [Abyssogena phaseoliformis symbiont]MBW5289967.1 Sulfoxide reductase heme-binding subunit YedZ [Candidatus Ruthia sp. Apha_13_S6]BBB22908.1 sulfite oxidase subunit YedZ [Abyssogena phaseoliformis symbiont OG214]